MQQMRIAAKNNRDELTEHLDRCRNLLGLLKDPSARKSVTDLIAYLERTLAAMDGSIPDRLCRAL